MKLKFILALCFAIASAVQIQKEPASMIVVDLPSDPNTIKIVSADGNIITESADILNNLLVGQKEVYCAIQDKPYY